MSAQETGTVIILNTSAHRTGKIEVRDAKLPLAKIGQHQWVEIQLATGEHVLFPKISSDRTVIFNLEANSTRYITLNFRMTSYLPAVSEMEFREVTEVEGKHWIREFGTEKRVVALDDKGESHK